MHHLIRLMTLDQRLRISLKWINLMAIIHRREELSVRDMTCTLQTSPRFPRMTAVVVAGGCLRARGGAR